MRRLPSHAHRSAPLWRVGLRVIASVATALGMTGGTAIVAPFAAASVSRTAGGPFYSDEFQRRRQTLRVVALGDSTLSGAGAGKYDRVNPPWESDNPGCYLSLYSVPNLFVAATRVPGETNELATNFACAGKSTQSIVAQQLPQMPKSGVDVVLLSGSANNESIAITKKLGDCVDMVVIHPRPLCQPMVKEVWEKGLRDLPSQLDSYYSAVKKAAPKGALVVAVQYANVFSKGMVPEDCDFIDKTDIAYFATMLDRMNSVIAATAKKHGFATFAPNDVKALDGHRTCDRKRGDSWVNDFTWWEFYRHIYEVNGAPTKFDQFGGHPFFHGKREWHEAIAAELVAQYRSGQLQVQLPLSSSRTQSGGSLVPAR